MTSAFNHPDALVHYHTVSQLDEPLRVDKYFVRLIPRMSRSKVQRLIQKGEFRLTSGPFRKNAQILKGGEKVEIWRFAPDVEEVFDVPVVYEDEHLVVVDKPYDLAIHPTARYLYRTLTHWLKTYYPDKIPHPCHRLDRETSGIVVCARTKEAESMIKQGFSRGQIQKQYLAVVRGHFTQRVSVNKPLALQGDRGLVHIRMIVDDEGLSAKTDISPIFYDASVNRSLVLCEPKTGRQHQIRAHLAHINYPIVGDKLYAMGDRFFDAFTKRKVDYSALDHHRQALHAFRIRLPSRAPLDKELIFTTELPMDLRELLPGLPMNFALP